MDMPSEQLRGLDLAVRRARSGLEDWLATAKLQLPMALWACILLVEPSSKTVSYRCDPATALSRRLACIRIDETGLL